MATPREQFIALRKSGMTPVQAREEVMKTVTPVSTNANVAQLEANKAKVQSEIQAGTRPEVGTSVAPVATTPAPMPPPAPIAPTTTPSGATMNQDGTVTPVTPPATTAPVVTAEVKPPEPVKTEIASSTTTPVVDYTQAQGREQEITNNVKGFIDSGMTPDQAKQASGYNEASPEKKAIIDGIITGASQGALLNEKDALNALISGVSVPKQNTQAFRNAEFKANKFRKFNSMTPTQLLDNLKMGEIGSEMDQLLSQNPNYAQAKQKLNELQKITNLNKTMNNLVTGAKGTEVPTITPEQDEEDISLKLMKKYGLDDANASAFAEFIATDEEMAENKAKLLVNKNQLSNVNRQIADATTLLNDGIKQLKKDYPDMSPAGIITLMGSRLSEFNDAITNLNSTKTLLQADIKDEMDLAKSAYDAKSEDIKAQNTIRSNLALNEAKSLQEKADAEAALNDPKTQIEKTINEFAKMGIVAQGDLTSKIAEYEASGKTLPEYISGLRQQFMSKPEYKKIQELQQGQLSDAQKLQMQYSQQSNMQDRSFSQQLALNDVNFKQDIKKMMAQYDISSANGITDFKRDLIKGGMSSEQADAIVRNETGNWNGVNGNKLLFADDGTFIKSTLKNTTNPNGGIECAEYISKMTGSRVGSTFEEKKKLNDEKTGTVGSIAVWQPVKSGELAKYGHAGVIIGEEGDNWIIKSANYNVDGRISTDKIPKSEIEGYRSTDLGSQLGTKVKLSPEQQRITANQEKSAFRTNAVVKDFEEMYSQNKNLITSLASGNAPGDMASVFQFMKSLDPASVVRETEFELAAKATGLADRAASIYDKVVKGEKLTDSQREEFGKLSSAYVQNKAKSYNRLYSDMERTFNYFGLPNELLPEKITVGGSTNANDKLTALTNVLSNIFKNAPKQ